MKILISNDDGWNSLGLKILIDFAKSIADEVFIVAPDRNRTACSHGLTLFEPIILTKIEENFFSINGKPADCIITGLHLLLKNQKPDFIFSGINIGDNLCEHIIYSGTAAAAREGALYGIKSIAFSQKETDGVKHDSEEYFKISKKFLSDSFEKVKNLDFTNAFYNINFPSYINNEYIESKNLDDIIKFTRLGRYKKYDIVYDALKNPRDIQYFWINRAKDFKKSDSKRSDIDIDNIYDGRVSITKVNLENVCK